MDRQELRRRALEAGRKCGCKKWGDWQSLRDDALANYVCVAYIGIPGRGERAYCQDCGGFVLWWSFERQAVWPDWRRWDPPPKEGARDGVYDHNCWRAQSFRDWVNGMTLEQRRYHFGPPD